MLKRNLLFLIAPIVVVVLNVGRWARAAAEGNWGGPLGEILLFGLLLYALYVLSKRRAAARQSGKADLVVIVLVILVLVLSVSIGRAETQFGSDPTANCRQPSGDVSSLAACDRLISSKQI